MMYGWVARVISLGLRLLTGAHGRWMGCAPEGGQRIYCVNHTSHLDFLLLWTALPAPMRRTTRPVAAADYWNATAVRRFLIHRVFGGVLVDRTGGTPYALEPVLAALRQGDSLIFFPEGTRGPGEGLLPLKTGIYHIAREWPRAELIPVWIDNAYRVLPKGMMFPVPLLCSITFGAPLGPGARALEKDAFLAQLRVAMLDRCPDL